MCGPDARDANRSISQPLDDHSPSAIARRGQRSARGRLEHVPRGLHRSKRIDAIDVHRQRAANRLGLTRSAHAETDQQTRGGELRELLEDSVVLEHAALERRGVNLIEAEPVTQHAGFRELTTQRQHRVILDLVDRRRAAVGRVGVPHLDQS
jgi:hypothetical protein